MAQIISSSGLVQILAIGQQMILKKVMLKLSKLEDEQMLAIQMRAMQVFDADIDFTRTNKRYAF